MPIVSEVKHSPENSSAVLGTHYAEIFPAECLTADIMSMLHFLRVYICSV